MANGGTLHGLVDDGKGRWGVIVLAVTSLATGIGWYFSQAGRDYTDFRIAAAISTRAAYTDLRYAQVSERLAKLETEMDLHDVEIAKVWSEIAKRIDRQGLIDGQRDIERRLDALERDIQRLRRALYGTREYENP